MERIAHCFLLVLRLRDRHRQRRRNRRFAIGTERLINSANNHSFVQRCVALWCDG